MQMWLHDRTDTNERTAEWDKSERPLTGARICSINGVSLFLLTLETLAYSKLLEFVAGGCGPGGSVWEAGHVGGCMDLDVPRMGDGHVRGGGLPGIVEDLPGSANLQGSSRSQ